MNWVRLLAVVTLVAGVLSPVALSQRGGGEGYGTGPQLITVGGGPGNIEQQVAAIDFAQLKMNEESRRQKEAEERLLANKELVASGAVSALDLAAPYKAVHEYNLGIEQLR